ncbi:MAG: hypothetical protein R8K22_09465 [Mariprofundaceae bacterium]
MYSCKEASEMVSRALDRKLTLSEWLNMKMHLSLCSKCRGFSQNIQIIEGILQKQREQGKDNISLSDVDRETIRQNIDVIMHSGS